MLFADGLTAAQLPDIKVQLPDGLKQYPDQPTLRDRESPEGITGIREVKIAIVPSRSGRFTLPAIDINWWNVTKRRMESTGVPEQQIEVLPAVSEATPPAPQVSAVQERASQPARQADSADFITQTRFDNWLGVLTLFLGLGWLATLILWWYSARRVPRTHPPATAAHSEPEQADTGAIRTACLANKPEAAGKALLAWGRARWPDSPPRTLGGVSEKVSGTELKKEIAALERQLYADSSSVWQGAALWQQLEQERDTHPLKPKAPEPVAPLHPV